MKPTLPRAGGRTRSRLLAIGAAILIAVLYALVASKEPREALWSFFVGPFASGYSALALLEHSGPFLVCALGACVAFRAGAFNLGGEGQASAGTLAAALAAAALGRAGVAPVLGISLSILAGAAAGAVLAYLPALAELKTGAPIMLTSFLVSQIALIVVDWAIGGPLKEPGSNLLAMAPVDAPYRLPLLAPPSPLSLGFPLALGLAALTVLFTKGTRAGMELRLLGRNPAFARAVGISPLLGTVAMTLSGAFSGIAGAFLVLGQAGRAVKGMTGGVGWNGLGVALISGTDGLGAAPAALFFSWLDSGSRQASILSDLSPDASAVLMATALFLITAKPGSLPSGRPAGRNKGRR